MALQSVYVSARAAASVAEEAFDLGSQLASAVSSRNLTGVWDIGQRSRALVGPAVSAVGGLRSSISDLLSGRRYEQDWNDRYIARRLASDRSARSNGYTRAPLHPRQSTRVRSSRHSTVMPYRRSTKSYGAGRKRARFAPRLRRRVRRATAYRARDGTPVTKKFLCESIQGNVITGIGTATTTQTPFIGQYIYMDGRTAGTDCINVGSATNWMFYGSLAQLVSGTYGNGIYAKWHNNMFEWVSVRKIKWTITCPVDPKQVLTAALPTTTTALDFSKVPQYDDDVTWIEDEGMFDIGSASFPGGNIPVGVDLTSVYRDRGHGAKRHKAFTKRISRSCRPRMQRYVVGTTANGLPTVTVNGTFSLDTSCPFITTNSTTPGSMWGMGLCFSYKGADAIGASQPKVSYAAETEYTCVFKTQLF